MSQKISKPTESTADELQRHWTRWHAKNAKEETPPKGSITALAYSEIAKTSVGQAQAFLKSKASKGYLKTDLFRIPDSSGYLRKIRHWWQ